jgi:glutamate dehydrogenase
MPEDPLVSDMLVEYFPKPLRQRFSEPMQRHPLRREILATHLTNALVNRVGCEFVHRLMEETDAQPGDIVRACIMARDVFDLDDVWRSIDALDNRVADDIQARMFVEVARLVERSALWFLRQLQSGAVSDRDVAGLLARCRDAAQRLAPQWPALLPSADLEALSERQRVFADAGVDSELAVRIASGEISAALLDIAEVASTSGRSLELVAGVYFALGTLLNSGWISERAAALPAPTHWDMLARATALADIARLKRALTTSALANADEASTPEALVEAWREKRTAQLERYARLLADLRATGGASLSMLLVIVREMAALERA